jgi:hypothetical protein
MSSSYFNTSEDCFFDWNDIHSIRFLLVHDCMLQEVFLGVGELWKVKHPLQVTCVYNPLPFFFAMLSHLFPLRVHNYYLFIFIYVIFLFWQYWTLLLGFGWIEMALCPHHAQTKVVIMTLLWSLCVDVAMQQQPLVFKSISMVVLEEVSTLHYEWWSCNDRNMGLMLYKKKEIWVWFHMKNQKQHIRKTVNLIMNDYIYALREINAVSQSVILMYCFCTFY